VASADKESEKYLRRKPLIKSGKSRFAAGLTLIIVGLIGLLAAQASSSRTGDLLFIFGAKSIASVKAGSRASGEIVVFNPTTIPVSVQVQAGCGCESLSPTGFSLGGLKAIKVHYVIDTTELNHGLHEKAFGLSCYQGHHQWVEGVRLTLDIL